jgi:archaeosine-15-forming tRNA-guanine transglycosylase
MARPKKNNVNAVNDAQKLIAQGKTVAEIAQIIDLKNETGVSVEKAVKKKSPVSQYTDKDWIKELRQSIDHTSLLNEFDSQEVDFIEKKFAIIMSQFNSDVLATERTQIIQMLKFEILMQRNMKSSKRVNQEIRRGIIRLNELYAEIKQKKIDGVDASAERDQATRLEEVLAAQRTGQTYRSKEYIDLQKQASSLMEELKATRQQRVTKNADSVKNFISIVKSLQDEESDSVKTEGRELELMRLAQTKERNRLSEYHNFMDGSLDKPILNEDTVE